MVKDAQQQRTDCWNASIWVDLQEPFFFLLSAEAHRPHCVWVVELLQEDGHLPAIWGAVGHWSFISEYRLLCGYRSTSQSD